MMIRSLFFAPANRHDLLAKFPRFPADCYVIDLEDGTPPGEKAAARARLDEAVAMLRGLSLRGLIYIRVNEPASPHYLHDIAAACECDIDGIVLPKLERTEQLFPIVHTIERVEADTPGRRRIEIMGGIESMLGVIRAVELCAAHPRLRSVYFGAEDFASDVGARRTPAGDEVLYARSQVLLAARASGVLAIDQAVVEIRDDQRCRDDANKGRDLGYQGKICVVPRQVELCNEIFAPTADEVAHARALIAAYEDACARGLGTIDFKGKMIDGPLLKRAQSTVAVAQMIDSRATAS